MDEHGFYRVAAASPRVRVGNPEANGEAIAELLRRAEQDGVELVVFPELGLTGYTCGDLFNDRSLLGAAREALRTLARESASYYSGLAVVGLPLLFNDQLFNVAAIIGQGLIHGIVPKRYLPNEKEFYEQRWFTPWRDQEGRVEQALPGQSIPVGDGIWRMSSSSSVGDGASVAVEICEDLWTPIPRSVGLAFGGANVICNPSASNDLTTKSDYRRQLVQSQSARLITGYVYASAGVTESTTDLVFGGHCLIAEHHPGGIGEVLARAGPHRRGSRHRTNFNRSDANAFVERSEGGGVLSVCGRACSRYWEITCPGWSTSSSGSCSSVRAHSWRSAG
jgi:NAD+ synthase (glutamine-hydrolysing)